MQLGLLEWTVHYIGLPDMPYRDEKAFARSAEEARDITDARLLAEYGQDNFDVITVKQPDEQLN